MWPGLPRSAMAFAWESSTSLLLSLLPTRIISHNRQYSSIRVSIFRLTPLSGAVVDEVLAPQFVQHSGPGRRGRGINPASHLRGPRPLTPRPSILRTRCPNYRPGFHPSVLPPPPFGPHPPWVSIRIISSVVCLLSFIPGCAFSSGPLIHNDQVEGQPVKTIN